MTTTPTGSAAVAVHQTSTLAVSGNQNFWSPEQLAALRQIGVQDAPNADLAVFLNYAQRTGLDPFARQIYMIGRREKRGDSWATKWTIQASIDGLRIVAQRSGDYAGQVGPEYCGEDGIWRDVWTANTPPVAARVGILRHSFTAPLYAVAYFDEYVQKDRDGIPTSMWRSKPKLMIAKCAEALALRKAFPNDLAGLYTADEMGASENHAPRPAPLATDTWTAPTEPAQEPEPVDTNTGEIIEAEVVEPEPTPTPIEPTLYPTIEPEPGDASHCPSAAQVKAIQALLTKCGVSREKHERDAILIRYFRREGTYLKPEASRLIDELKALADSPDPVQAFQSWLAWLPSSRS